MAAAAGATSDDDVDADDDDEDAAEEDAAAAADEEEEEVEENEDDDDDDDDDDAGRRRRLRGGGSGRAAAAAAAASVTTRTRPVFGATRSDSIGSGVGGGKEFARGTTVQFIAPVRGGRSSPAGAGVRASAGAHDGAALLAPEAQLRMLTERLKVSQVEAHVTGKGLAVEKLFDVSDGERAFKTSGGPSRSAALRGLLGGVRRCAGRAAPTKRRTAAAATAKKRRAGEQGDDLDDLFGTTGDAVDDAKEAARGERRLGTASGELKKVLELATKYTKKVFELTTKYTKKVLELTTKYTKKVLELTTKYTKKVLELTTKYTTKGVRASACAHDGAALLAPEAQLRMLTERLKVSQVEA
eukprot:gene7323-1654_t